MDNTTRPILPPLLRSTAEKLVAHSLPVEAIVHFFGIDSTLGLSSLEVAQHQAQYGPNNIQSIRPRRVWRLLVDQFASVVIAVLAMAALIAWATGDVIEATVDHGFASDPFDFATHQTNIGILRDVIEIGGDQLKLNGRTAGIEDQNVHELNECAPCRLSA